MTLIKNKNKCILLYCSTFVRGPDATNHSVEKNPTRWLPDDQWNLLRLALPTYAGIKGELKTVKVLFLGKRESPKSFCLFCVVSYLFYFSYVLTLNCIDGFYRHQTGKSGTTVLTIYLRETNCRMAGKKSCQYFKGFW